MLQRARGGIKVLTTNLAASGIPSSGSVAANGALTLTTALSTTYSQGVYLYFPAGAAYAGSTAGLYWCVMSSTTLGTIFDNKYTTGTIAPPTTNTPIVAAGPGAYTQTTALDVSILDLVIPAGTLLAGSQLIVDFLIAYNSSATAKGQKILLGGTSVLVNTQTTGVSIWGTRAVAGITNNNQVTSGTGIITYYASSSAALVRPSINATADTTLVMALNVAAATDTTVLEYMALSRLRVGG